MSIEDQIKYERLKKAFEITNQFFQILSDGYNPVYIRIDLFQNNQATEDEIIKANTQDQTLSFGWHEKNQFQDLALKLEEILEWNLSHLKAFNDAPKVLETDYHLKDLNKLIKGLIDETLALVKDWDRKQFEYIVRPFHSIDSWHLLIKSTAVSLYMEFYNCYH